MRRVLAIGAAIAFCSTAFPANAEPPSSHSTVQFQGTEWTCDATDRVVAEEYLGRAGLHVLAGRSGSALYLAGVEFQDGTIEVDIAAPGRSRPGIGFRGRDEGGWRNMVLFNCWNGSSEGGERIVEQAVVTRRSNMVALLNIRVPPHDSAGRRQETHDWFHVKLVIQGDNVKVYLGANQEPSFELGAMFDQTEGGTLGFFGSEFVFANFRYTTLESATCPHGEDAN